MSYANLIAVSLNNPKETFIHLRNFLCRRSSVTVDYSTTGIGWTLHDSYYAISEDATPSGVYTSYFVVYSPGEDGQRNLYYKISLLNGGIQVTGYLYWNNTTHTGVQAYNPSSSWNQTNDTNNILWVYGDLDNFIAISKYGSTYFPCSAGWLPNSIIDQTVTICPNSITAGSSRTVTFTAVPGAWTIGTKIFVRDTANIERVTITNISGNDVTFATFVASYGSGCKFTLEQTEYSFGGSFTSICYFMIDHSGAKNATANPDNIGIANPTSGDGLSGLYPSKKIFLSNSTMWVGPMPYSSSLSTFSAESTHTIGAVGYRFFPLYSTAYSLIKEV